MDASLSDAQSPSPGLGHTPTRAKSNPAPRKPHRKSRNGCKQCKRRRVKCDELRPACSACDRMALKCDYAHGEPTRSRGSTTAVSPRQQLQQPALWQTVDMRLLHHYMSCSCLGFSVGASRHECWTINVPDAALEDTYLLHQLLAVAALHIVAQGSSDSTLIPVAAKHRKLSLEGVRPVMSHLTPEGSISLFAFAGLAAIYSYAEISLKLGDAHSDVTGGLLSCFQLSRGISTVLRAYRNTIRATWAAKMIDFDASVQLASLRSCGLGFRQLDHLYGLIESHVEDQDVAAAYSHAARRCLENISLLLHDREAEDDNSHLIMSWPNEIDEILLQRLERREPVAMIILAHFAVLMNTRTRFWWLDGLPLLILEQVEQTVPENMRSYLNWPSQIIKKDTFNAT